MYYAHNRSDDNETVELPCGACGSYMDDCRCTAAQEHLDALRAVALSIEGTLRDSTPRHDDARIEVLLRQYGYR